MLAAVAVFAIAAGVIGREAHRLDAVAPRAVYDLDEAVYFVADRLPRFAAGQLTHDEVRELLRWHMLELRAKGLQPPKAVDAVQAIEEPVVMEEDSTIGYLIGRADDVGMDVPDEAIAAVVEQHFAYFEAIGAVGPEAADPDLTGNAENDKN
ncbi:MAG: hypothetical protein JWL70_2132 [Acidimicrobiia bacterium]|nr:hypothetical protein [Acidimicrobiia bacterium]